jgi:hypothetical protein
MHRAMLSQRGVIWGRMGHLVLCTCTWGKLAYINMWMYMLAVAVEYSLQVTVCRAPVSSLSVPEGWTRDWCARNLRDGGTSQVY